METILSRESTLASEADGVIDKGFGCIADCAVSNSSFNLDSRRIVRLEWRKTRREQHRGLTSHSFLQAHLANGRCLRIELFADGLSETALAPGRTDPRSHLYRNRVVEEHELSRPLKATDLREVATAVARSNPYCLINFNCHNFAREVWNAVVINSFQVKHYPDRLKVSLLHGLETSVGSWLTRFGSFASRDRIGRRKEVSANAASTDGTRIWGEVNAVSRASPWYDRVGRLQRFGVALETGAVYLLKKNTNLLQMSLPDELREHSLCGPVSVFVAANFPDDWARFGRRLKSDIGRSNDSKSVGSSSSSSTSSSSSSSSTSCTSEEEATERRWEAWAKALLPDKKDAVLRLAEHMGTSDLVELVARILKTKTDSASSILETDGSTDDVSSLSYVQQDLIADLCYVMLVGQNELRVVIYALVRPDSLAEAGTHAWHLRLLSGDACTKKQNHFHYTLWNVLDESDPAGSCASSAVELARAELHALRFGLDTRDWNFVILQ